MQITFRQGVVSHQETGFLEPNGSGGVRIAAATRSTTITLAHRDTNYTHSEDNNVEAAWPGPFPAGENYYLYWEFDQLTYLRSFGYTTFEPVSQSVPPGHGNSPIVAAVPGVASPIAFGSFEVQGHYVLATGKTFAVVGSTGSPNNDGVYTVQNATYDLVTGNTTITVNEAVATSAVSGELTLDIDSKGLPLFLNGRHWYDTANNIHYVLDNANQWIEVLRVFAANLFNGTQFLSMSIDSPAFTGTQIGDRGSVASGRVLFGDAGNPIRRDNNTFFTTEDQFFTNQSRVDAIRLESNVSRAQAFSSSLAQFGIVAWRADGQIASADYADAGDTVVGVLTESILVGQVGAVITQGTVTNSDWNWTASLSVGAPLWIQTGELVGIDPFVSDNETYSIKQVPVARVLSVDTIIFEQGLGGVGPQGATGTITDLAVATSSTSGVVWITNSSLNTSTDLVPVAVSDKHSVIIGGPYSPLTHSHTAAQTSFTPTGTINESNVFDAIVNVDSRKLSLIGGTMSGFLTLSGIPTADFHAATKQYVDALFQGLDAKEASLVGTTELLGDIGGLYSSIGGTGGTGAITGALVSKLDGTIGVDYDLALDTRILVKDQTDAKENGIYVVTAIAAGSPPLTIDIERSSDFDSNDEIRAGNYTVIRAGETQAGQGWVLTDIHPTDDIELNAHDIDWTLVSSAISYLGSSTIDIDGSNVISVIDNTVNALNSTQWNTETITLSGSPSTGQVLTYNAGTSTWENSTPSTGQTQTPWLSNINPDGFSLITDDSATITPAKDVIFVGGSNTYSSGPTFGQAGSIVLQPGVNTQGLGYGEVAGYGHGLVELRATPPGKKVTIGSADVTSGYATALELKSGSSTGIRRGADLTLNAGDGYTTPAGDLTMYAGSSDHSYGGYVTLQAGHSRTADAGSYKPGGFLDIAAGNSTEGPGGSVTIYAGDSTGTEGYSGGGAVEIRAGNSPSGRNQYFSLPSVIISGGSNEGTGAVGGNVVLSPGRGVTGGGTVEIHGPTRTTAGGSTSRIGQGTIELYDEDSAGDPKVVLKAPTLATDTLFQLPNTNGNVGEFLQTDSTGITSWAIAGGSTKPSFERFTLGGSPVSQVLNTTVSTIATGGSPIQTASLQVFRNGILQNEGDVAGSPITNDFEVTGANQLTFAPDSLQPGGVVIIYVFN